MRNVIVATMFAAGCGSKTPEPVEASTEMAVPADPLPQARPAATTADPASGAPGPEGTAELQSMLMAWHSEDLPTRAVLDHHANAQGSLLWMARNGQTMVIRVRAMGLLGLYPSVEAGQLLDGIASDDSQHPSLRAGAMRGLGGQDLAAEEGWRETLEGGLGEDDMRVQIAAVESLTGVEASVGALQALSETEGIDPRVKEAVTHALGL